ncbi:MAG: hypothetical protein Ct9H90mP21_2240 [Methanobacteriota archaeon]|nr:MAG: hypothetical protein Ct9H90mP21_2240 [Euryarchaeota archaeon]
MESDSASMGEPLSPVLQVENLTVARSGEVVIQEVNLDIRKGEFVGLVGPNGSGKTTLLLTILGLLEPVPNTGGTVRVYGNEVSRSLIMEELGGFLKRLQTFPEISESLSENWLDWELLMRRICLFSAIQEGMLE